VTIHQPERSPVGDVRFVPLAGEYDVSNSTTIVDALLADVDSPTVVGDLSATTFMDSTSLRALIEVRARLQEQGRELRLVHPSPTLQRLFEVSGLGEHLGVQVDGVR
jgi:anti-anti-sigma factor